MAINPLWSPFSSAGAGAAGGAAGLLPWATPVLMGVSLLGKLFGWGQEEPEEPGMSGQYRPSQFSPQPGPPLPQYDPRQRQPRSTASPEFMNYLRKYIR